MASGPILDTIIAVRRALEGSQSPHRTRFTNLINNQTVGPLKTFVKAIKEDFGGVQNFPKLGRKISLLDEIPDIEEVQKILYQAITKKKIDVGEPIYVPSSEAGVHQDRADALALLKDIAAGDLTSNGVVPNLNVPKIRNLCATDKDDLNHPTELFRVPPSTSILPMDHHLELQHNTESFTYTSLLAGSIIYIIWPPTEQNLSILKQAYDNFSVDYDERHLDVSSQLHSGVTFVQRPGDGLRVPPFAIMMGLTTKPCVMIKYQVTTTESFFACIRHIPLYKSYWATEASGAQQETRFIHGLVSAFGEILSGKIDAIDVKQLKHPVSIKSNILTLMQEWNKIKEQVIEILDDKMEYKLRQIWETFLKGSKTKRCLMCGRELRSDRGQTAERHLQKLHWMVREVAKQRAMDSDPMDLD